jgi:hypothetical protein
MNKLLLIIIIIFINHLTQVNSYTCYKSFDICDYDKLECFDISGRYGVLISSTSLEFYIKTSVKLFSLKKHNLIVIDIVESEDCTQPGITLEDNKIKFCSTELRSRVLDWGSNQQEYKGIVTIETLCNSLISLPLR